MSTTMPNEANLNRKWYIIDAANKPLGRTAAVAATLLRGKHKPVFAPHADCGDHVIIINAEKAILTGKKLDQKMYYRHTGYIGGLKQVTYTAKELGVEYLTTLTISDIAATGTSVYTFRPYTYEDDGTRTYGDTIVMTFVDGVFSGAVVNPQ